jgi:putative SOS response-associated peptidase YedK
MLWIGCGSKAIWGLKPKQPYAIGMKGGEPFALAGMRENWQRSEGGEWVRTFAIMPRTQMNL